MTNQETHQLAIDTIRTLSTDVVQQAKFGHPGTPLAYAVGKPSVSLDDTRCFRQLDSKAAGYNANLTVKGDTL